MKQTIFNFILKVDNIVYYTLHQMGKNILECIANLSIKILNSNN